MLNCTGWFRILETSLNLDKKYLNCTEFRNGDAPIVNRIRDVQQKSHIRMIPVLAGKTPARLTTLEEENDISDKIELDTSTVGGTREQPEPPFQSPIN